jgi:hypothetical protein
MDQDCINKKTVILVRQRTIPIERSPPVNVYLWAEEISDFSKNVNVTSFTSNLSSNVMNRSNGLSPHVNDIILCEYACCMIRVL